MKARKPSSSTRLWGDAGRLRQIFDGSGLTQPALSERAGMGKSAVNHYLTGRIPIGLDAAIKLARALDVPPWLIVPDWPREDVESKNASVAARALARTVLSASDAGRVDDEVLRSLKVVLDCCLSTPPG